MTGQTQPLVSIIVPAYNEAERISQTLQAIDHFFSHKKFGYEVLVVNDGSRDETVTAVESLNIPHLRLIGYAENRGKGYAVNFGVGAATGEWVLITDADNSTAIEQFDLLYREANQYSVIIGSRYLKGSHITVRQGIPRIALSRLGNILVQLLILPGIHDSQCGFKLLKTIEAKPIFALQTIWRWGFDMEILRIAKERGLKIKEVPIEWRNDDQSRIQSSRVFIKTLGELFAITFRSLTGRYQPIDRPATGRPGLLLRFVAVGALGTLLDFAVLNLTHVILGFSLPVALTLGFLTGALNNYLFNSLWSFGQGLTWSKLGRFLFFSLIGLGLNNLTVLLLSDGAHWNYNAAKLLAVVIVFVWNYGANKKWTFTS